jgi:hypothetical protein
MFAALCCACVGGLIGAGVGVSLAPQIYADVRGTSSVGRIHLIGRLALASLFGGLNATLCTVLYAVFAR